MTLFDRTTRYNVIITISTQVIIAISFLVMLGALSRVFPKSDMGLYGNYKSLLQFLFFLYTFGMDIGLARYLGFYSDNPEMQDRSLSTVVVLYLVLAVVSTGFLYAFRDFVTVRLFGGDPFLFHCTVLALALLGTFKIIYTYYQGMRRMVAANLLQLAVLGGGNFLVTALVLTGVIRDLRTVVLLLSVVLAIAIPPLVVMVVRRFHCRFNFGEMIRYSFPRAPHIFLSGIILTFGIMLASYFYSYAMAGDFTVTTRLFRILGMGAYGFNMVLLPGVAAMAGTGRSRELNQSLERYGNLVMHLGIVAMFVCYVLSPPAIRIWLTDQYVSAIPILRIFSFSIPLYLFYLMFRSAIHGMDERPIQLYIDLASFAVLLASFFLVRNLMDRPAQVIAIAMALAFATNGLLSIFYLHRVAGVRAHMVSWGVHAGIVLLAMWVSGMSIAWATALFVAGEMGLAFHLRREWSRLLHL